MAKSKVKNTLHKEKIKSKKLILRILNKKSEDGRRKSEVAYYLNFNLMDELTVYENIELKLIYNGVS